MRPPAADAPRVRRRRRAGLLALSVGGALAFSLALTPAAFAGFFTPKAGGSPNADQIDSLYKIILYIAAVVFVVVEGALVYSVYKFRAKKGAVAAQIHGNTRLEIGWTVMAALILVVLTVVTFVKLPSIINPPASDAGVVLSASTTEPTPPKGGQSLTICVQGRQFIWRYVYGNGCLGNSFGHNPPYPYSYSEMYAPAGATVILAIQSTDVIHSWWIPSLGGKVDAVPGYTTYTWFKMPASVGTKHILFHGQCAQLCGRGHAAMVATVQALTPAQYNSWASAQSQEITSANRQVTQLRQQLSAQGQLCPGTPGCPASSSQ